MAEQLLDARSCDWHVKDMIVLICIVIVRHGDCGLLLGMRNRLRARVMGYGYQSSGHLPGPWETEAGSRGCLLGRNCPLLGMLSSPTPLPFLLLV